MSLICTGTCVTAPNVPASYYDCNSEYLRKFGASKFILQTCDTAWTDILSTSEWSTKIASSDIAASPPGILTIGEPSSDVFVRNGCGRESLGQLTYVITYETYEANAGLTDWSYFNTLFSSAHLYRIMLLDCNGIFHLENDWVAEIAAGTPATIAGTQPGFEFSVTKAPHQIDGDFGNAKWNMEFTIKTPKLIGMALLPGVPALL